MRPFEGRKPVNFRPRLEQLVGLFGQNGNTANTGFKKFSGQGPKGVAEFRNFFFIEPRIRQAATNLIKRKILTRDGDIELHLVMEFRIFGEAGELMIDQTPGDALVNVGGQERIKASAHVDIRAAVKIDQQGIIDGSVSHERPGFRPDAVRDQRLIERQRQRTGCRADHLGWVPIGHFSQDRGAARQTRHRFHGQGDLLAGVVNGAIHGFIRKRRPLLLRRQGPNLQDVYVFGLIDAEFDVQFAGAGYGFQFDDAVDQFSKP